MDDTPNLNWLREEVRRLNNLLQDAHPGLFTWQAMYAEQMTKISNFWTGNVTVRVAEPENADLTRQEARTRARIGCAGREVARAVPCPVCGSDWSCGH